MVYLFQVSKAPAVFLIESAHYMDDESTDMLHRLLLFTDRSLLVILAMPVDLWSSLSRQFFHMRSLIMKVTM